MFEKGFFFSNTFNIVFKCKYVWFNIFKCIYWITHPVFAYAFETIEPEMFAFKYNVKVFEKNQMHVAPCLGEGQGQGQGQGEGVPVTVAPWSCRRGSPMCCCEGTRGIARRSGILPSPASVRPPSAGQTSCPSSPWLTSRAYPGCRPRRTAIAGLGTVNVTTSIHWSRYVCLNS